VKPRRQAIQMKKLFSVLGRVGWILVIANIVLGLLIPEARPRNRLALSTIDYLESKVGQLIIVGFSGTSSSSTGFRSLIDNLQSGTVGGVLFLSQNVASKTELTVMVHEVERCSCSNTPIIAIDEEGGTIERLGDKFGFQHVQSAAEIGSGTEENARIQYRILTRKLRDAGFNINFGPVVDLNTNPENPVIGRLSRSYSRNSAEVEKFAKIFIEEHHAVGILTVLKHFPGHGSSSTDSHLTAVDVGSSWSEDELQPYRRLKATGMIDAIMVGHLINKRKWGGVATQDGSVAIHHILRGDLKFDGVVISDDLTMDAVNLNKDNMETVLASSLNAGVDVVLVAHPDEAEEIPRLNSSLVDAVMSGKVPLRTIEKSLQRVSLLKAKLVKFQQDRAKQ
jgi:beta-N-acetylhexosaminidase